jgi:hypothetical protein
MTQQARETGYPRPGLLRYRVPTAVCASLHVSPPGSGTDNIPRKGYYPGLFNA